MNDIKGKYVHYKGNEYEVVGVAKHSETLEPMVVYKALYGDGGLWVRPYDMFFETVEINGEKIPRYTISIFRISSANSLFILLC